MSDLLLNVSLARKSLQRKRQMRSKDLSLNFMNVFSVDTDRSKTERNLRLRSQDKSLNSEVLVTSPLPPRRFEFQDSLASPLRLRSYKLDATGLLVSRVSRFLNKHFLIWKKKTEHLRDRERELFRKQARRLKVSVGRVEKNREVLGGETLAGKIVRKSQDFNNKVVSNIPSSFVGLSDDDTPMIESGHQAKNSSREQKVRSFAASPLKNFEKRATSPRYASIQVVEKGILKLGRFFQKDSESLIQEALAKLKQWQRLGKIKSRIAKIERFKEELLPLQPEETSSPSLYGDEGRVNNKQVFQGCIQNLRDFINEKRERKDQRDLKEFKDIKNLPVTRLNLDAIQTGIQRIFEIVRKNRLFLSFHLIFNESSSSFCADNLFILLQKIKNRKLKFGFEKISFFCQKNFEKTFKKLMKNVSRDIEYRLSISFKYWKTSVKSFIKQQEEFSLSAVTIHNILLNIINCRTKVFFSTYKLAMIKYLEQNQERFKNYSKAINRLSLCLRDYKLKPFITWKYSITSLKIKQDSSKKYIFRLDRALKNLLYENLQFSFSSLLVFAKQKTQKLRTLNRIYLKSIRQVFYSLKLKVSRSEEKQKNVYSLKPSKNPVVSSTFKQTSPKKFSFKYLRHCTASLVRNLTFHQKSLKKNTVIKWKLLINQENQIWTIQRKYEKEIRQTRAAGQVFNKMSLVYVNLIRLSFMKLRKAEY